MAKVLKLFIPFNQGIETKDLIHDLIPQFLLSLYATNYLVDADRIHLRGLILHHVRHEIRSRPALAIKILKLSQLASTEIQIHR